MDKRREEALGRSAVATREKFPEAISIGAAGHLPACDICTALDLSICESGCARAAGTAYGIGQSAHVTPARRTIWRPHDADDVVPVICNGWAAAIVMLTDGSRQIVSFLLPGDLISTAMVFDAKPNFQVEAITEVEYRLFSRTEFKALLYAQQPLMEIFSRAWVDEKARADQLIVDLGRRTADEKIARLILTLADRLARRGMVRTNPLEFDFPLRQHHIADATGLTPVHVSKVLTEFRRRGLIAISERSMIILDPAGLRRVGNMR